MSKRREGGGKNGPKLRGRAEEKAVSEAKLEERPLSGTNPNQDTFTAAGTCQAMGVECKEFSCHLLFSGAVPESLPIDMPIHVSVGHIGHSIIKPSVQSQEWEKGEAEAACGPEEMDLG